MFVRTYMTRDPITISPDSTYPQALSMIRKNKIRHLPVVDGGRLVGILVEQDLLSNQPSPATTLSVYEIYSLLDSLRVRQILTRPVITVEGDCPLEEAARIMVENKISCLPVMDGNRLVGLITQTDVFKVLVEVLGGQEDGLRLTLRLPEVVGELARVTSRIAEAGGNIVAVTSSRVMEDREREVTLKAYGADAETLKRALSDSGAVVEDIRTTLHYQPRLFE